MTATAASSQEKVAGTIVTLTPPANFEPATGYSGFGNDATGGSFLIAEMPATAHDQLGAAFVDLEAAKTNFAPQGVIIERRETIDVGGAQVPLLIGTQTVEGVTFSKWIALLKGSRTVLVTAQSPQGSDLDDATVMTALRSITLGEPASLEEKIAALPMAVTASEPFKPLDTLTGSGILLTTGEVDPKTPDLNPMVIAVFQIGDPAAANQQDEVAESLLRRTAGFEAAMITDRRKVPFAGEDGTLLMGTTPAVNGEELRFAQYLTFGAEGRFILMTARAPSADFARLEPSIKAIADSISFKN